jgi:redox-sensitive bicupin YhaK (pirin superfamily)
MVGAWCFLDHIGPMSYGRGKGINVGPHPHTALQTFTWVIEGEMLHRDSLGYEQIIRPGQVNLMTAGRGVSHAEDAVNDEPGRLHVAQLWIALPDRERQREPSFHHYAAVPVVEAHGFTVTVVAGSAFGQTAPAAVFSSLVGVDFCCKGPARVEAPLDTAFEHAILVLDGAAVVDGEPALPGELLYLGTGRASITLASDRATRALLIGGEPFGEEVLLWWNFAGRTTDELRQAVTDWNAGHGRFGEVRGSPSPRVVAPSLEGIFLKQSAR